MCTNESNPAATNTVAASDPQQWTPQTDAATPAQDMGQAPSAAAPLATSSGQQIVPGSDDAVIAQIRATPSQQLFDALLQGAPEYCRDPKGAIMLLLSIIAGTTQDVSQINRIFVRSALKPTWWGEQAEKNGQKGSSDWAGYYIRKALYACKAVVWTTTGWKPIAMFCPDENPRYSDDDIGISTLFCDIFRHTLLKCKENDSWYVYDGVKWALNNELAMEYCKAFVVVLTHYAKAVERADMETFPPADTSETGKKRASKGHPYVAYIKRAASRRARETILSDAKSVSDMSISKADFDKDEYLFNCKNGTVDLRTYTLRPHSPADHITKVANVTFAPGARSQLWEQHIATVMDGDVEKAEFLQKAIGYALTGSNKYACMMILYGPSSRNGKSATVDTINKMMGDYGGVANPETFAQRAYANGSGHNDGLAQLAGTRFVSVPEVEGNMTLSSSLVKRCTGDGLITTRAIYEKQFSFVPQFKLFMHTNHLPRIYDLSMFDSGRVKVIPFTHFFEEHNRNPNMVAELTTEENLSGIFNWALGGLQKLESIGFDAPQSVLDAIGVYRQDSDRVGNFINEMMAQSTGNVSTTVVFAAYKTWCENSGLRAGREQDFKKEMERHGISVGRPRINGKQVTSYMEWVLVQP